MVREAKYKETMTGHYNQKARNTKFEVGDLALWNYEANRVDKIGILEPIEKDLAKWLRLSQKAPIN